MCALTKYVTENIFVKLELSSMLTWLFVGDTLPSRTRRIDPSQFMLHHGGTGSQPQLPQSTAGSQPQLNSPSRPRAMQPHSFTANNGYTIELLRDVKLCRLA